VDFELPSTLSANEALVTKEYIWFRMGREFATAVNESMSCNLSANVVPRFLFSNQNRLPPLGAEVVATAKERWAFSGIVGSKVFGTPQEPTAIVKALMLRCSGQQFAPFWLHHYRTRPQPMHRRGTDVRSLKEKGLHFFADLRGVTQVHFDMVLTQVIMMIQEHACHLRAGVSHIIILNLNRPVANAICRLLESRTAVTAPPEVTTKQGLSLAEALRLAAACHNLTFSAEPSIEEIISLIEAVPWLFKEVIIVNTHMNATGSSGD
jgi:hypothetical protein